MIEDQLNYITAIVAKTNNFQIVKVLNELKDTLQKINASKGNIQFVKKCLEPIQESVLKNVEELSDLENNRTNQIQIAFELAKIGKITEMLPYINEKPKNTIFNEPDYMNIENIDVITLDQPESIKLQLKNFYNKIQLGHAYIHSGKQYQSTFVQSLVRNMKALYYISNEQEAELTAKQIITNPTLDHALTLWRIIDDSKIVKTGYKMQLEQVKLKKIIYIPRLFNQITLDSLHNPSKLSTDIPKDLLFLMAFRDIRKKQNDYDIRVRVMSNKQIFKQRVSNQEISQIIEKLIQNDFKKPKTAYIKQLPQPSFFSGCCVSSRQEIGELGLHSIENIIIHIHGGGFISMSSFSHQCYTRKWANQLNNSAIFSIDYRLAPEYPFPHALDDCWQFYMWIIHFSQAFFNIVPKNIILTGDSAGGNLALGILTRAIETGQRKPDKILLQYPAINLNLRDVVPSNVKSLDDKMIPMALLMICRESYLSKQSNVPTDYYASPIYLPSEIIRQFPDDFIIFVGQDDVLLDNSVEFIHNCINYGYNKIKLKILENLPHGFQNMGMRSNGVRAAEQANRLIIEQLQQFIN